MQILIGSAKRMTGGTVPRLITGCTDPTFERNANSIAMRLGRYTAEELEGMLKCSRAIASETHARYRRFHDPATRRPALFSYDGTVYRSMNPSTMDDADLAYAQDHLFIGSYLYGLLRPLDLINPYRLEGNIVVPGTDGMTMTSYWKPILTGWFIDKVKQDDGVLVNLASNEFRNLFDWKRVESELEVVSPEFKVEKGGQLRSVAVHAKKCRGAMTRWLIVDRVDRLDRLQEYNYSGC